MSSSPRHTHTDLAEIAEAVTAGLPGIKVVKGQPDEAELAALVTSIISARSQQAAHDDGSGSSVWGDPRRRWGVPPAPNRAAWRWSSHQAW